MPLTDALATIGGRWTLAILISLLDGPMRFTDLRRALPGISAKLLTIRLRELQTAGLLQRDCLTPTAAIRGYALGPQIGSLRTALRLLCEWTQAQEACSVEDGPGPPVLLPRGPGAQARASGTHQDDPLPADTSR